MRPVLSLAALLCAATLALAQPSPTPWWKAAVCPMVGPFNRTSGTPGKTPEQILDDFQPEVAEWSCLPELVNHPHRTRKILGGLEYQEFPQGPKRDYQLWQDKFGFPFEPTEDNGVAVNGTGKLQTLRYGSETPLLYYVCHNAPRWHDFHKDSILRAAKDPTCALVRQDNIGSPCGVGWDNGGWCKWCLAGFKARLQGLAPDRLKALGVADIATFDAKAALQTALKKPAEEKLEDPLLREYTRFMLASNLGHWRDEVAASHAARPEVPICGNQGAHGLPPYPFVLLSDASDLIFLENSNRAFGTNPNSLWYALNLAGGRHSKPAWIWDFGSRAYMDQVAGSQAFVAECYVHGATPYYEINNLGWDPRKGYVSIPMGVATYEALAKYAQFAHRHSDLLIGNYAADTRVALLHSVPSFTPRYLGATGLGGGVAGTKAAGDHFVGFARALEAAHVPYNIEVMGDAELWPDSDLEARLAQYGLVICPDIEALSDAQIVSLRKFQQAGGRLAISGLFATRDESFTRRPQAAGADLLTRPRTMRLQDEPVQFLNANAIGAARGASQTVQVNQTEAKPLVVRGWSKAEQVSGPTDNQYGLWVDLTYTDGTPLWAQVAPFRAGTHDWQMSEFVIHPGKPVKSATVHALFRYHSGRAWFDDLFFGEQGTDTNLLQNPGCEGGDGKQVPGWDAFLGWQKSPAGYVPDTTVAHSGQGSITASIPPPTGEAPARTAMLKAVAQALMGVPHLETTAPATVQIRPYRHGQQVIVQLLNVDLDADKDEMKPCAPFAVSVPLPAGTKRLAGVVTLSSPDGGQQDITLTAEVRQGVVTVKVPGLHIWSIISLRGE